MSSKIDIRPDHLKLVRAILSDILPCDVKVWVFGSRATWQAKDYSDLDLALEGVEKLSREVMINLETAFEESDLPWKVDVLDVKNTTGAFLDVIERDRVLLIVRAKVSEWEKARLGDYSFKIGSGATPKGGSSVYMNEGEIFLIRSQNIYNDQFQPRGIVYINQDAAKKLKNAEVLKNDILLNITGDSVARCCFVDENFLPAYVNQHVAIIRTVPNEFDPKFVRYALISSSMQNHLLVLAGCGATRNALTKNMIENLELPKPHIDIQRKIGDYLKSLDDKIENNRKINKTLEAMAQAIFKSWFVDFDPVHAKANVLKNGGSEEEARLAAMCMISGKSAENLARFKLEDEQSYAKLATTADASPSAFVDSELGEIPLGWRVEKLCQEIYVLNGFAFKSKNYVGQGVFVLRTKNFDNNSVANKLDDDVFLPYEFLNSHEKYMVKEFDYHLIMVGASVGNRGIVYPCHLPALRNQNMWCFRAKDSSIVTQPFTKYLLDELVMNSRGLAAGSAREFFRKGDFGNQEICIGNESIQNIFFNNTVSLLDQMAKLTEENQTLISTRDTLLPKLLSGEIDVSKVYDEGTK